MKTLEELQAEIAQLKQENQSLKSAHQAFLHHISHELKTPSNALFHILTELQDLIENPKALQELYTGLYQAQHINHLLEQLVTLDSYVSNTARVNRTEFNLSKLLKQRLILAQQHLREKQKSNIAMKIAWNYPADKLTAVVGDKDKLYKILDTLLFNAVEYTDTGAIEIVVDCLEEGPANVALQIQVIDSGRGMTESHLNKVFEPFSQYTDFFHGDNTSDGLSLMLCQRMIKLMSGHFDINSELGKGTTATIRMGFPTHRQSLYLRPERSIKANNPFIQNTSKPILVVDDNQINRNILSAIARRLGFEIKTATNGQEAIASYDKTEPALIFMDCQMPVMNGFEAVEMLRQERKATLPIIAVTANTLDDDIQLCLQSGMDDVISKPITPHKIAEILSHWVGHESRLHNLKDVP